MTKKPYNFRAINKKVLCEDCGRPLKRNVLDRKEKNPRFCYKCSRVRAKKHSKRGA